MELGQLTDQRSLDGTALNGIEIGDVALVNFEQCVKGPEQRNRVSDPLRRQLRSQRSVADALTRLRMYRYPAGEVENGNDLHA